MKLKLISKNTEAEDTVSFFFEPEQPIQFLSGQYFYITLPKLNYKDERGPVRQFTISSSPTEGNSLRITTRIREKSGYKKTLNEMSLGEVVDGQGPNGVFTLVSSNKPIENHLFLAGGIGITPFRSIIKSNVESELKTPIYLIYSNSDTEFVFKEELDLWSRENKWLNVYYHDTSKSGRINLDILNSLTANYQLQSTNYWISGPPSFLIGMEDILNLQGIGSELIHLDKFTGY